MQPTEVMSEDTKTKITMDDVTAVIVEVKTETIKLVGKSHTITAVKLRNGFTIVETSTSVDPRNYSVEIGEKVNMRKIYDKIFLLLGYVRQSQLDGECSPDKDVVLSQLKALFESAEGQDSLSDSEIGYAIDLIGQVNGRGLSDQERVRLELRHLAERTQSLKDYIGTEPYYAIPKIDQERLKSQYRAMTNYRSILEVRVANFRKETSKDSESPA